MPTGRPFQIELEVSAREQKRVAAVAEDWLSEWRMPCNLMTSTFEGKHVIRAAFNDERHARAFELKFGGRRISDDELIAAMAEDVLHEDLFDQLARDFPE